MRKRFALLFVALTQVLILSAASLAQVQTREARAAQWDSYQLPTGKFARFVDRKLAFALWRPAEWKESRDADGTLRFVPDAGGVNLMVTTEEIADGLGVANYTTAILQQLRQQGVSPDSLLVRPVFVGGHEGREVTFEIETNGGGRVREALWIMALGPRAYGFWLIAQPDEFQNYEPVFKRAMLGLRVGVPGQRFDEFETLREKFGGAGDEVEAALIAEAVRRAGEPGAKLVDRLVAAAGKSPGAVADLLLDHDPQVRAAAIAALGRAADARTLDALAWALGDGDVYCSAVAAQSLAAKRGTGLALIKSKLGALAEDLGVLSRVAAALPDESAREVVDELLKSDRAKNQIAALRLAAALPLKGWELPHPRLFAAEEAEVVVAAVEAAKARRAAQSAPALLSLVGGDYEYWAAQALGEFNASFASERLAARVAEIDKRLGQPQAASQKPKGKAPRRANAKTKFTPPKEAPRGTITPQDAPPPPPPPMPAAGGIPGSAPIDVTTGLGVMIFKSLPETERLALVRGAMVDALELIAFRDSWEKAKDEAARRAVLAEAAKKGGLRAWAVARVREEAKAAPLAAADLAKLNDAPTTGETLFPRDASLYLAAPNLAATIDKFNAALSGVQMETVRDQMIFTMILKTLKTQVAASVNAEAVPDAGAALGIDLKAPVALAAWPGAHGAGGAAAESALVLRVADRARFERQLLNYLKGVGGADSFVVAASAVARFVGVAPAAVPAALLIAAASDDDGGPGPVADNPLTRRMRRKAAESVEQSALVYARREAFGELPVTVIEKLNVDSYSQLTREAVYVAYLNSTAVVAPSRAALVEVLRAHARPALAESKAYAAARGEQGEVVFFSQLGELLKQLLADAPTVGGKSLEESLKYFGLETGALRLSPTTWETVFNLRGNDVNYAQGMRPFKAAELSAPRDLLPRQTLLYAGSVIDPRQTLDLLKKTFAEPSDKPSKLDAEIEALVPHLHGEVGAALVSLNPMFATPGEKPGEKKGEKKDENASHLPAMVAVLKLKGGEAAKLFRAGKLFSGAKLMSGVTALGAPVAHAVDEDEDQFYLTVTDNYLVVAESVATLRLLEAAEKLAATRDYTRTAAAAPDSLTLLVAYSQAAAFDDARALLAPGRSDHPMLQLLPVASAVSHAFHSQRAFVSVSGDVMRGQLAVSFDREGRYSVGDLEKQARDFDLLNAIIAPKGLSLYRPTRLESLKLRVKARQPGVVARVREDVSKFASNRVESADDTALVFRAEARRIPDNLTVKLPVAGAEFAPYLRPTERINSTAPEVVQLAKEIAGDDKDGRSVARKLGEWTYKNLRWKRVNSDTLDTLASREADCYEHSELYVALARASGLPARVVSGAAYSGGSFGAHAWVEVYLGKWVEVDPTWGLTEHVDATHLRFEDGAFVNYAMLNQLELEVVESRATVADFQRDPAKLVEGLSAAEVGEARELAFDLALTADEALGAGQLAKLEDKQRDAVVRAFERRVGAELEEWAESGVSLLKREVRDSRATLELLRDGTLLSVRLAARDGAWHVTEVEDLDEDIALFADALRGALKPGASLKQLDDVPFDRALKQLDALIAAQGEQPSLLLYKARVLDYKYSEEESAKEAEAVVKSGQPPTQPKGKPPAASANPGAQLLRQVMARWPDYAPALYAYAAKGIIEEEKREPIIAVWRRYAQLRPSDPRPWHKLVHEHEKLKQFAEAESAFREMIGRDPQNVGMRAEQALFYLSRNDAARARASLAEAFKLAAHPDEVFDSLGEEYAVEIEDLYKRQEELVLAFPDELGRSKSGLRLLADAQDEQGKKEASLKTMERVLKMEPEAYDYNYVAYLNRALRRYKEAAAAAEQAIKLEEDYAVAHFHLACALAQLNRKTEAVAALTKLVEKWPMVLETNKDDAELQPLTAFPEFKALLKKAAEAKAAQEAQKD